MLHKRTLFAAFVFLMILGYACRPDNNSGTLDPNFDHAGQALRDDDSLMVFFANHYYDDAIDSVKPLVPGATALIDDTRLMVQDVEVLDVDYKLYFFVKRQGDPDPVKGFPTVMDSVLVKYRGEYLVDTDSLVFFDERVFNPIWLTLNTVIRGWAYGFGNFKGGRNISGTGPILYENGGKGVLFIPSGMAWRNGGTIGVPPNANVMFHIELYDLVEDTDHDSDTVASIDEDPDGDGNPTNDDTDGDGLANFLDPDDDNDGIPTRDEDANGDGDPTNDFNDPNNPDLPDYLNPDIVNN
jgi:hypothetical protein